MKERVCLIDGSGYIFRAYYASPEMTNPEGLPVNALYGFINMFLNLTENIKCDYCLVLFDAKRENFRNTYFKDYKATRPPLPENLKPQFQLIHEALDSLNLKWLQMEGYEADDLIATFTELALKEDKEVTIVSADKDLMQLIKENVSFYDSMKNRYFSREDVKEKFGVYPELVTAVQALAGDSTDNVPGVPGIGIKTAAELVNTFGSLKGVLERAEEIHQNKRRELILNHKQDAEISELLVTLKKDVPVEMKLTDFRCMAPSREEALQLIERHAFKSLKNKTMKWLDKRCGALPEKEEDLVASYHLITNKEDLRILYKQILEENGFSFDVAMGKDDEFLGLSVGLKKAKSFYIPLGNSAPVLDLFAPRTKTEGIDKDTMKAFLTPLMNDNSVLKISLNLKENLEILEEALDTFFDPEVYDDVAIMSYALNSSSLKHTLKDLAEELLDLSPVLFSDSYKKVDIKTLGQEEQVRVFAETSDFIMRLYQKLVQGLKEEKKLYVYNEIDKPLVRVLHHMEHLGVMVDTLKLKELDMLFDKSLNVLSEEIYALAGTTFNLSSPKQIGDVLFNKLGLKGKKHTSGSLNTSAEVLERLAEDNEIAQKILEWRSNQKLKSTYTTALLSLADKNQRVHTTYNQISVNTGRLSSLNPNLQNIPIRTPQGKEIRNCFIAKENHKLIAVDYSQVELRLLATIADVKFLQEAFNANVDIHRKTASEIFNIPYDEVDADHRRRAKAINFGIVYGMSSYGLAKEIGATPKEAESYMNAYFQNMPEIKQYMEDTIKFAHTNGYVLTPFNRKISIYGINEANERISSFGERAAINAPIQGGASDIIKMAMDKIFHRLLEGGFKTKMLLQVHDELVFEAPCDEVQKVSPLIKQTMEEVTGLELKVPLIAELGVGDNWGEAH